MRTPADEAISFFESDFKQGEPIRVYELILDPDGGPNKDRQVAYTLFHVYLRRRVGSRRDLPIAVLLHALR